MGLEYAEVIKRAPVQRFLLKFWLSDVPVQHLILVSPFVGTLEGARVSLRAICRRASERQIPTYVITRGPEEDYQREAVQGLQTYDPIELRFNQSLHAKLYVCTCEDESKSIALLGSANLTRASIENNIEIGMMIYGRGRGRIILRELSRWGLERLRTLSETELVKRIHYGRRS